MGQVQDRLRNQNWKMNGMLVLLVAVLGAVLISGGAFNSLNPLDSDTETDVPEGGDFAEISYNEYSTPFTLVDSNPADNVYLVASDAEMPENYGDYTNTDLDTSDLEEGEDYIKLSQTDGDGDYQVAKDDIGQNEFVTAGSNYTVAAYGTDYINFYGEVAVPETIEKFAYKEGNAQTATTDVQAEGAMSVATQQIEYDGDRQTSGNLDADKALDASDINDSETFTAYGELEEDGTGDAVLFGSVDVSEVTANSVNEVTVEVVADGEVVYSETASGDDIGTMGDDFVAEDMEKNPVEASDVEVTTEVDFDSSVVSTTDGTDTGLVDVTVNDLEGSAVQTFSITG